jgi:hypothetical protein
MIAFENRRRIVIAFSTPENPFDPGRPEGLKFKVRCLVPSLLSYDFFAKHGDILQPP